MEQREMIVDDDKMVTFLHQVILAEAGLSKDPVICDSGEKALEEIIRNKENLSWLVFLDINMPGMSGWEFLNKLNMTMPDNKVQVIIVSSSIDQIDRNKSETYHNVLDYVEKPLQVGYCREIKKKLALAGY